MAGKNIRNLFIILLAAVLASGALGGCREDEGAGKKEEAGKSSAARGRYVEEDIQLPLDKGEQAISLTKSKEGNPVVFVSVMDRAVRRCEYIGGKWEESSLDWYEEACKEKEVHPVDAVETKDGAQFIVGLDDGRKTHIIRSMDGRKGEDLKIPYLDKKTEYGYPAVINIQIDRKGNYWLQDIYQSKVIIVSFDTLEVVDELESMSSGSDMQKMVFAGEDGTIAVHTEEGKYTVYDEESKEQGELAFGQTEDGQLANDGENWYMVSEEGITRMKAKDDGREVLMDGSMGAMGAPVNSGTGMICTGDGEFYVLYSQWKTASYSLAHYVYDKDAAAVPEHTLQVFGLSENDTVWQAISGFQRKHPDVKVEYKTSGKETEEITSDDIRTLNTELLSKKGADVLMLNGLPTDAYIEKGVLADITKLTKNLMKENAYLENIMENTVQKNGKIYGIPVKFTVPVMYGDEQIEKALDSLDSLKAYLEKNPDAKIFGVTEKGYIRDFLFQMYQKELIKKDGSVDKAKMEQLLGLAVDIVKNSKTEFFEGMDMDARSDTLFANPGSMYLVKHPDMVATDRVRNLSNMMIPCKIAREQKIGLKTLKNYYIPEGIVGINSNTGQKGLAEEFLKYLFSEEVQGAQLDDGFPVLVPALEAKEKEAGSEYAAASSMSVGGELAGEEISISAEYPRAEEVRSFIKLCKTLKKPANQERAVWNIYQAEASKALDGSAEIEECAENIRKKVELYLAE